MNLSLSYVDFIRTKPNYKDSILSQRRSTYYRLTIIVVVFFNGFKIGTKVTPYASGQYPSEQILVV